MDAPAGRPPLGSRDKLRSKVNILLIRLEPRLFHKVRRPYFLQGPTLFYPRLAFEKDQYFFSTQNGRFRYRKSIQALSILFQYLKSPFQVLEKYCGMGLPPDSRVMCRKRIKKLSHDISLMRQPKLIIKSTTPYLYNPPRYSVANWILVGLNTSLLSSVG